MNFIILWMYWRKTNIWMCVISEWFGARENIALLSLLYHHYHLQYYLSLLYHHYHLLTHGQWSHAGAAALVTSPIVTGHWSLVRLPWVGWPRLRSAPLLPLDNGHLNWPMPPVTCYTRECEGKQQEKLQCFRVGINFCFSLSATASACTVVLTSAGNVRFYTHQQ